MRHPRLRLATVAVALATASSLALTACGGGDTEETPAGNASQPSGPVTLTLNAWGEFGLDAVAKEYKKTHPDVTIQINSADYDQQHQNLQKFLVAGSGAPDIAMIDEGYIVQFRGQADKFTNLSEKGADEFKGNYLDWKWQQGQTADGGSVFALGADVGGLAMCYRRDLFEAAGLPSERDEVSALWPDWDSFIATGQKYVQGSGGKKFVDAGVSILNPVLGQQPVGYFDTEENLQMDGGPKVAWDTATKVIDSGISANLPFQTAEWNAAMAKGDFAVLACPAWMQGYIQGQAPKTKGNWDIAAIPGGGGSWGGSFFSVPKQGKNVDAAWDFIKFATSSEQQINVFQNVGLLPSQPVLYKDPAIQGFKNPFFNNAPVGQIFTTSALNLKPQYLGRRSGAVRVEVSNVLTQVQQGKVTSAEGWELAKAGAQKAAE